MNTQNNKPDKKLNENTTDKPNKTGLDEWNERLDHNLEPEAHGDTEADERAIDYSAELGSGDQSDDKP